MFISWTSNTTFKSAFTGMAFPPTTALLTANLF
jgi:hypothetical protein